MARWTGSPQYLKHLQKIRSMSPERRAVTQGMIDELGSVYADADMQKQLAAMKSAAIGKSQERALELGGERLAAKRELSEGRYDLRKDTYEHQKDMSDTAEILGWGNIGLSGLVGYGDMKHKKKMTKLYQGLMDKY